MTNEDPDPSQKCFVVFICEIKPQFIWAEQFTGRCTKSVTLSDGTTRTIGLTSVKRNGRHVIEFTDAGHRQYMELLPIRNDAQISGNLMVRVLDMDDVDAAQADWGSRLLSSPVLPPETSLLAIPEFVPAGFAHGIEILNDNKTPMQFVTTVLAAHAGLSPEDSNRTMVAIHERGGTLLPTGSLEDARRIAAEIATEAAKQGYPLRCRAVSILQAR